jgi:hypothetical protein
LMLLVQCPTDLRTVAEKGKGTLDNGSISHNNVFDSFPLSMLLWH